MGRPQLYSTYALATELQRDARMLAKALAPFPADGTTGLKKVPGWKMTTALQAVAVYDATRVEFPTNGRTVGNADLDRACVAAEQAAAELEAAFTQLAGIKDIAKRREQAKPFGPLIGKYAAALEATTTGMSPAMIGLSQPARDDLLAKAASRFLQLMRWRVAAD